SFLLVVLLVIKVRNFGLYRYWSVRVNLCMHNALQDMTKVSSHFVRGSDPEKFASVIVSFMGKVRHQ
ncbi:hypothetical protein BHM03_00054737, partial [Ensete ventricosum]